eukprot:319354-Prymnesium_polylepis.1
MAPPNSTKELLRAAPLLAAIRSLPDDAMRFERDGGLAREARPEARLPALAHVFSAVGASLQPSVVAWK